jgi:hypothetical protein
VNWSGRRRAAPACSGSGTSTTTTCWPWTPQARDQAGRHLVRLIAGNPVTMGQMTRHLPAAGSYAPVTILIQELPDGGTQVAYDTAASAITPYGDAAASQVAQRLDTDVLSLLRHATGIPATAPPRAAARRSRRTPWRGRRRP